MKKAFAFSLITFLAISGLLAQTIEVDGITYNITSPVEPYTVEVTSSSTLPYSGDIVVPADVYFGRDQEILARRDIIKQRPLLK